MHIVLPSSSGTLASVAFLALALGSPSKGRCDQDYADIFEPVFNGSHSSSIERLSNVENVTLAETGLSGIDDTDEQAIEYRSRLLKVPTLDGSGDLVACWERVYLVAKDAQKTDSNALSLSIRQSLDNGGGKLVFATAMLANQMMVRYKKEVQVDERTLSQLGDGFTGQTKLGGNLYLVKFAPKSPTELYQTLNAVRGKTDLVENANLDHLGVGMSGGTPDPDDKYYPQQWNLPRIRAKEAWESAPTAPPAVVAIFDTGLQVNHPDIYNNRFTNPKDGSNGWNFTAANGGNAVVTDANGHGTQVAGIIGAETNNSKIGIAGICRSPQLMPIVVTKTTADAVLANYSAAVAGILYLRDLMGGTPPVSIQVANYSWGGTSYNSEFFTQINNSDPGVDPLPPPGAITAKWAKGSYMLEITGGTTEQIGWIQKGATVKKFPELSADLKSAPIVLFTTTDSTTHKTYIVLSTIAAKASAGTPLDFVNAVVSVDNGILHVAATGGAKAGVAGSNLDASPRFPACFPSDLLVSVGASKHVDYSAGADSPMKESNFGKNTVHLFAPGEDIWSTTIGSTYKKDTGASFSAAHVSGALAYYFMTHPGCTATGGRAALLKSGFTIPVTTLPAFKDLCTTNSRLDMKNLIDTACDTHKK